MNTNQDHKLAALFPARGDEFHYYYLKTLANLFFKKGRRAKQLTSRHKMVERLRNMQGRSIFLLDLAA